MSLCSRSEIEKCETILCMEYDELRQEILSQIRKADDPALFALAKHVDDGHNWALRGKISVTDFGLLCRKTAQLRKIQNALHHIRAGNGRSCFYCADSGRADAAKA